MLRGLPSDARHRRLAMTKSGRGLPLIERNILMILFPAPSSGNARAPCHARPNGRSPAAGSSWPVSFSSAPPSPSREQPYFRSRIFQGALVSGAAVDVAAGAVPPPGASCASATPAASEHESRRRRGRHNARQILHRKLRLRPTPFRPDPITSAAARTPGFWRRGRAWTGYA